MADMLNCFGISSFEAFLLGSIIILTPLAGIYLIFIVGEWSFGTGTNYSLINKTMAKVIGLMYGLFIIYVLYVEYLE